jgi:hypothetical protein
MALMLCQKPEVGEFLLLFIIGLVFVYLFFYKGKLLINKSHIKHILYVEPLPSLIASLTLKVSWPKGPTSRPPWKEQTPLAPAAFPC